jgi:endonuclease/exonuclease/phosphatase family metal-dependent hydrolase
MIQYKAENIAQAAAAVGKIPHLDALKTYLPGILEADIDNSFSKTGKIPFKAVVSNMETGDRFKEIAAYFTHLPLLRDADVIFANELDWGMARSGNAHITREMAGVLGMNYAYGVEFLTVKAGRDGNGLGLHGNAILSKFPLSRVKLVRLPIEYDWFYKQGDSRLGMRMAVMAEVAVDGLGQAGLVCVHLENRATPLGRKRQLEFLLDEVEKHFPKDMPVLIGGDMNTNTVDGNNGEEMRYLADHPGEQWRRLGQIPSWEPQLDYAASRGFGYEDCNILAKPTRRKPMDDGQTVLLNLDWFYQRGFDCSNPVRVESIFHCDGIENAPEEALAYQGKELSDHDMVLVNCGRKA